METSVIGGQEKTTFSTSNSVHSAKMAGRPTDAAQAKKRNLANAQQHWLESRRVPTEPTSSDANTPENGEADNESSGDDIECTRWTGGVIHCLSSSDEPIVISSEDSDGGEVEELSGSELEEVVQECLRKLEAALQASDKPDAYSLITCKQTQKDWKKAESHHSLGYNGQSVWTKRHHDWLAWEREKEDEKLRNRWVGFKPNEVSGAHMPAARVHPSCGPSCAQTQNRLLCQGG